LTRRLLTACALVALALGVAPHAQAARYAIGVRPGADIAALTAELERRTGSVVESLLPVPALLVDAPRPPRLGGLTGIRYVERVPVRRVAFVPNDPLTAKQWYLAQNRAYDAWTELPPLAGVRVAVIDSGADAGHPELTRRIVAARSFVGGSARTDFQGHGTFVAGLIAAETNNQTGIAGLSPAAELLIAKVVTKDRTIPVDVEARAIRWAVDSGARVINMSLGGLRDPLEPTRDTFSRLEADAVAYAVSQNVVVVAAVGNSDQAPAQPWRYASWPAALPHVLGVSAFTRSGSSPAFSNRDAVYNDLAAPGQEIVSTFPRALTAKRAQCVEQGYSLCGPDEYRFAEGTSFAAPQVSAAAATLLGTDPGLRAEQVIALLERTAVDANPANGCRACSLGRDAYTGWGRLDVAAALANIEAFLARDTLEPNDDAGRGAYTLWGAKRRIEASLDFWDDQNDVYRVRLRRGQRVYASLIGPRGTDPVLAVWRPGTRLIDDLGRQGLRARVSRRAGPNDFIGYRARRVGWHFLQVKLPTQGAGAYRLTVVKVPR
jgi:subtilisin family serine protease